MKPKIVFFDIDGTLLDEQKQLPGSTLRAVKQLQDKGVFTAIATGRGPFMHHTIRKALNIQSYISFNGQYVVLNDEEIFINPIPVRYLEELNQMAEEKSHPIAYLGSHGMAATHDQHPFITKSFSSLKQQEPILNPNFYKKEKVYQGLLFFEKDDIPNYLDGHEALETIQWHENSMDVIPKGGSKARGIQEMLNYLEIDPSEAVAFGDGLNDIEMLQFVGHGIAMGNAVEEAKLAAKGVTARVDEDGIEKGLQKLGLL